MALTAPVNGLQPLLGVLIRIGLTWSGLWALIGAVLLGVAALVDPGSIDEGEGLLDVVRILGGVGLGSGLVFGLLLALAERRTPLAELPLWRVVPWAVLASMALPLLTSISDGTLANTIPFGILSALVCRRLARRTNWFGRRSSALASS